MDKSLKALFTIVALFATMGILQVTGNLEGWKMGIPALIALFGLVWIFWKPVAKTEKPEEKKEDKKKDDKKKTKVDFKVLSSLFGALVFFGLLFAAFYFGIPWVNSFGRSAAYMPVPVSFPEPSMVGHDYRPPEREYTWEKELNPEVEYKVFPVSAGQSWKWDYLEDDIEYRVETEGTEPWVLLHKDRVQTRIWTTQRNGKLMIRTMKPKNVVRIIRLLR